MPNPTRDAALILAGGLGLGAFQGGVLAATGEGGLRVTAIAGSSIGAVNGAIIAGGPREGAAERLRGFWAAVATEVAPSPPTPFALFDTGQIRHARNWTNTLAARTGGARGLFRPRAFATGEAPSLYDPTEMPATLARFVDFAALNDGSVRFCLGATDVETGELVVFDTAAGDRVGPEHLLASGALMPAMPPVRIAGRLLGDAGFSANALLEPFLASDRREPIPPLCLLVDLFAPDGAAPRTLEDAAERAADLKYATQTSLRLVGLQRERALEARLPESAAAAGTDLLYLSYRASPDESGPEKAYDFSRATLADRWRAGEEQGAAALRIAADLGEGSPAAGLRVHPVRAAVDKAAQAA